MNKLDTLGKNFVTLTEEDLMNVEGGSWDLVAAVVAVGWGIYQVGEAAGRTIYYITHP